MRKGTVNNATFGLKGARACISGMKNKEKYMEYQKNYRETYGVYPELDRINNPYTARWDDVYKSCCLMRKSGFGGALYYHDLHNRYRRRLKYIYEHYSKEWSFFMTLNEYNFTNNIKSMAPTKNVVNNLGYYKSENGNYYEGTWSNNSLVYGLVYLAEQDVWFIGSFDESGRSNCCGVAAAAEKSDVTTSIGKFRIKNGEILLYESKCLVNCAEFKNGELLSIYSSLGQYVDGYAEGTFIDKEIIDENDIRIRWDKYRDGEVKSSMSFAIECLPRLLMMFYMLPWYAVKYVYGLPFLFTPLYYIIRKKTWRI